MKACVTWKQDVAFDGLTNSGYTIPLDGKATDRDGASPMEVVLIALCGCSAMSVVSILTKKREVLRGLIVSAVAEEAAQPPRVFTGVKLTYHVTGAVSPKAMEDAVQLSETKYCPVAAMVSKTAEIESVIEYSG